MDRQVSEQIDRELRANWAQICPQILDRFTTVPRADVDAARDAEDLVRRIAAKSHFPRDFVETEVTELVLVGAGIGSSNSGQGQNSRSEQQTYGQSAQGSPQQSRSLGSSAGGNR